MLKVIGISILLIPIIIVLGCIESQPSEPTEISESPFVTKNASEMVLKIEDLPAESKKEPSGIYRPYPWKLSYPISENETHSSSHFEQEPYTTSDLITSEVWKYSTTDEAKQNFHVLRNNELRYFERLPSAGIGDESFIAGSQIYFRKANIVAIILYSKYESESGIYESTGSGPDNAKKYAKILEKKI